MVERVLFRDRKHPVNRVIINDFNRKSGADLGEVTIVYGPAADEYTRSHHALALVLGTDIFCLLTLLCIVTGSASQIQLRCKCGSSICFTGNSLQ